MIAFVIFSGYFYKSVRKNDLKRKLMGFIRTFIVPYAVWGVLSIALGQTNLQTVIGGFSFSNKLFVGVMSVGPIYFILLLFVVKVLYLLIDVFFRNTINKNIIFLVISLMGYYIGRRGIWLPWSFDIAMYVVIFYHLGYCFRKCGVTEYILERYYCVFPLLCIWVFMIYCGGNEIDVRKYGAYGLTVIGAVSGTFLLQMLSRYLTGFKFVSQVLSQVGEATLYILIVHVTLREYFIRILYNVLSNDTVMWIITLIVLQVLVGVLIFKGIKYLKQKSIVEVKF